MVDIQFVKASDYCESVVDGTHDSPKPCDEGFYLITSKHLSDYEIDFASAYKISEADYNLVIKRSSVEQWDILFSMIGTVGRVYIERNSSSEYACKNVGIFKCGGDRQKALWLYYVLKSPYSKQYIAKVLAGSTQSYISLGNLRAFPVPVIDDEKRNRIVEVLSTFDKRIEVNNKIIKNLEKQLDCLFDEKCTSKGQFSSSVLMSLSDIATFTNGLAMKKFPPESEDQFLRVLKIKELRQGALDESSDKCAANIDEKFKVNDGDVIFSWSGSLMVDLWTGGVCGLNQHLFKVTSDLYPKWFVYMWVKHHVADFAAIAAAKATTMGHIKRGDLDKAKVVIPNDECMKELTKVFDPLLGLLITMKMQNKKLSKLRDMLLPKLMSGELELKN